MAVPAEKVRDHVKREVIFCAGGVLSATQLTYSLRPEILDHRNPETTAIYAKVDQASLHTLALAWPGGVR
jgi:hypothetical protein